MKKISKVILAAVVILSISLMTVDSNATMVSIPIASGQYSGTHNVYGESGYASATETMAGSTITYLTARVSGTAYNISGNTTATYESGTVPASSNFIYAQATGQTNNGVIRTVEAKAYFNGILISNPTVTR